MAVQEQRGKEQIIKLQDLPYLIRAIETEILVIDYRPVWVPTLAMLRVKHAEFFVKRRGPDGKKWKKLAKITVKRKGHDQPLVETDEMRKSLLSVGGEGHIEESKKKSLLWGTDNWKAAIHQYGVPEKNIPARPWVGWTPSAIKDAVNKVADHVAWNLS